MLILITDAGGVAKPLDDVKYAPDSTTVAILPVMNLSGEKDDAQRLKQAESGNEELSKRFIERGFKIADPAVVRKAVNDLKIDLNDEEQHKRASFYAVGRAVKADLAVFVVITDVNQRLNTNVFAYSREGKAKLKVWLVDVKRETPILSAYPKEGKSSGGPLAGIDRGSIRIVRAVGNGLRDALKDFFKPYPVVMKDQRGSG